MSPSLLLSFSLLLFNLLHFSYFFFRFPILLFIYFTNDVLMVVAENRTKWRKWKRESQISRHHLKHHHHEEDEEDENLFPNRLAIPQPSKLVMVDADMWLLLICSSFLNMVLTIQPFHFYPLKNQSMTNFNNVFNCI